MNTICREELKEKLDRGVDLKLIFAMGEWHYRNMHIPGSVYFTSPERALKTLGKDDEIVVYWSNVYCRDSVYAYHFLVNNGYQNVRRYSVGLEDWVEAGNEVHGIQASTPLHPKLALAK